MRDEIEKVVEEIDHVGIAVNDIEETLTFYEKILGMKKTGVQTLEDRGLKVAFLETSQGELELLEPISDDNPIVRHLERRGEGIQHLAFKVKNIDQRIEELKTKGVKFLAEEARPGAGGKKIIFIHPGSAHGVLIELCEEAD